MRQAKGVREEYARYCNTAQECRHACDSPQLSECAIYCCDTDECNGPEVRGGQRLPLGRMRTVCVYGCSVCSGLVQAKKTAAQARPIFYNFSLWFRIVFVSPVLLIQIKDYYTTQLSKHHLHISLLKVGRMYFLNLGMKGLTLSLPSSAFSEPFKEKWVRQYNHLPSEWPMKIQVLHTVWCYISAEAAGEIWNRINLGSERVKWQGVSE